VTLAFELTSTVTFVVVVGSIVVFCDNVVDVVVCGDAVGLC